MLKVFKMLRWMWRAIWPELWAWSRRYPLPALVLGGLVVVGLWLDPMFFLIAFLASAIGSAGTGLLVGKWLGK